MWYSMQYVLHGYKLRVIVYFDGLVPDSSNSIAAVLH